MSIPEAQTIQLNADGPLDSEMSRLLRDAIRRARDGGVTRLLDGNQAVAELGPPSIPTVYAELLGLVPAEVVEGPEAPSGSKTFHQLLTGLINATCREKRSNTPDYLLAGFIETCLKAYEETTRRRDNWYGVRLEPGNSHFT